MLYPSSFELLGIPGLAFACGVVAAVLRKSDQHHSACATRGAIYAAMTVVLTLVICIVAFALKSGRSFEGLCIDFQMTVIIGLVTLVWGWPFSWLGQRLSRSFFTK